MAPSGCAPRTYTLEEKITFVTKVDTLLRAGLGKMAAAQAAGTNWASYKNWVQAGVRPAAAPTPVQRTPEERARLVAAVEARVDAGMTVKAACAELGIRNDRYFEWRRALAPPPAMRPVEIAGAEITALVPVASTAVMTVPPAPAEVTPAPPAGLCLVAPGGYRIEGLAVETAAQLLRALG